MTAPDLATGALRGLDAADADAVAHLFADATEKQRRAAARDVLSWTVPWEGSDRQWYSDEREPYIDAFNAARLAVSSLTELKKRWRWSTPPPELAARVLADRRPKWLESYAGWLLERPGGWATHFWPMVRVLVRRGLIPRPEGTPYILAMINGVFVRQARSAWYNERDPGVLVGCLLDDAELLEHELWRLFEVEGTRDLQLGVLWEQALPLLAEQGHVSRRRLLQASLDALARDFAQHKAGWYTGFHEKMAPTLEERDALQGRYLALLGSRIPPTVSFALKALRALEKAGTLDHAALVERLPPALDTRHKNTAKAALWLLRRIMERSPALRVEACRAATVGLAHAAADVQGQTLDLLEAHGEPGDPQLTALVADRAEDVAPSVRPRLEPWLGQDEAAAGEVDAAEVEALMTRARAVDPELARQHGVDLALSALAGGGEVAAPWIPRHERPCLEVPVVPVADLDELLDVLAHMLEDPGDAEELERLLDGLSRLCHRRPDDLGRRAAPLLKRARTLRKRHRWQEPFDVHHDLQLCLCGAAEAWLTGELELPQKGPCIHGVQGMVVQRLLELARRAAAGEARSLLAAPTHAGGWIDARALVRRHLEARGKLEIHDAVQALLRLAPEGRAAARRSLGKPKNEYGRALAHALGARTRSPGRTAALWFAAARARCPLRDDPLVIEAFKDRGPDAGRAAVHDPEVRLRTWTTEHSDKIYKHHDLWIRVSPRPPGKIPARLPTVALHEGAPAPGDKYPGSASFAGDGMVRSAAGVWPLARESFYAEGARRLAENLHYSEARWDNRLFLEPLLQPHEPLGPMATLILAIGLSCKDPGEHALAADALIAAVEEGRLDGARLGASLAPVLVDNLLVPTRLARALGECARVSTLLQVQVRQALERCLQGDAPGPRGLHAVLELLHELSLESGAAVAAPEARAFLEGFTGGSKAARLARSLLALEPTPRAADQLRAAAAEALELRLARATE